MNSRSISQSDSRRKLAACASRLLAAPSGAITAVDWNALHCAPDWLSLHDDELTRLQCRLGALIHASEVLLWIDRPRLARLQHVVGDAWLRKLRAERHMMPVPVDGVQDLSVTSPDDVAPSLRASGATMLVASVHDVALRQAVTAVMGATDTAQVNSEMARALVARAQI